MTPEEIKSLESKLESLGKDIDAKIEKANGQAKEAAEGVKETIASELKKEIDVKTKAYGDLSERLEKAIKEQQSQLDSISTKMARPDFGGNDKGKSTFSLIKDALEASESFKAFKEGSSKSGAVNLENVNLHLNTHHKAADMTTGNTVTGVFPALTQVPGIKYDPDTMFSMRSIMSVGVTDSNGIIYVQETAIDDGTTNTAEGSAFTESDVDMATVTENVRKIGTYLTMSDEMVADIPQFVSYITTRFGRKLVLKENQQILYGLGTGQELTGITVDATAYSDELADADVTRFDVLAAAAKQCYVSEYAPNAILVHPTDYLAMILAKDDNGNYILPNIFTGQPLSVNGVPVYQTTAITSDGFLVGDFRMGTQLWDRLSPQIEFTNADGTNFQKNLTTVRIYERIALTNYRPNAFRFGDFSVALARGTA